MIVRIVIVILFRDNFHGSCPWTSSGRRGSRSFGFGIGSEAGVGRRWNSNCLGLDYDLGLSLVSGFRNDKWREFMILKRTNKG
jgi:hypothetical protein